MKAIQSAQNEWESKGAGYGVISPARDGPDDFRNRIQDVKFDVAVTAATKTEGGGGGGIKVVAFDLSGKINRSIENATVSHISFPVPFLPPTTVIETL
ncbi:MAG: hypothetical protein ABR906_06385 [Terracidiphilus sp.]|jgi:hypothetical protein